MIQEIIDKWLDKTENDLIENYDRLGLRASGSWAKSLEQFKQFDGNIIKIGIKANDYTIYLEQGRQPNASQDQEKLKAWVGWAGSTIIKDWVDSKGININPYAIAWKIAREGWEVPNRHNAGGLVSDVLTRDSIDDLNKSLTLSIIEEFKSDIINKIK